MKKVVRWIVLTILVLLLIPTAACIFLCQVFMFVFEIAKDIANDMTLKFIDKVETIIES